MLRIGSMIAADTSPSMRTRETASDRSVEWLENVCWRLRKPVTVNTIELTEV
jgi:hypothetical protein